MDKFRNSLKKKLIAFIAVTTAAVATVIISYIHYETSNITGHIEGFMRGVQTGLFAAGAILSTLNIYSIIKALRSEKELRRLYIKETDERDKAIKNRMSYLSFWTTFVTLLVATIVAVFYSTMVFFTLLGVLIFMCVTVIMYKLICYKNM